MADDSEFTDILVMYLYSKKQRKRKHKYWVHDIIKSRKIFGEYHHLVRELFGYEDKFFQYFRMLPNQFNELLAMLKSDLTKETTRFRKPITPEERLAICLRFLSSGDSYATIAFSYRVGKATVSKIVSETCNAIWKRLQPIYMPTPTHQQWQECGTGFEVNWQLPNCLGALDGKHVQICTPKISGSNYLNYKKTFSIVLLALVDYKYCFSIIDVGSYGSNSDGGIFRRSLHGRKLMNGTLDIPADKPLHGAEDKGAVPYVIIGDETFHSTEHLVRPVPGTHLTEDDRIFNYRLSRATRISENAFGILANRWRLYYRKIQLHQNNVDKVVKATCVIHNMLQMRDKPVPRHGDGSVGEEDVCDGILGKVKKVGHRQQKDALAVRDKFKEYFVSEGGSRALAASVLFWTSKLILTYIHCFS